MSALALSPLGSDVVAIAGPEPDSYTADRSAGYFVGKLQIELVGPRGFVLLAPFAFVEANGRRWECKAGDQGDGSSIPWLLQRWVGSPLVGLHRFASVIHDRACVEKARPYEVVHHAYYLACRAAGERKAWALGQGVKWGGPRWEPPGILEA